MQVFLAIVTEHTFDNKWDSYSHHAIFTDYTKAYKWAREQGKHYADKYGAELIEGMFPVNPEAFEDGFVYWEILPKTINSELKKNKK